MPEPRYAVTVTFEIRPDHVEAFRARVRRQAEDSLAKEPGCHRFDVWLDAARPTQVYLYELYDDRAAFDAHRETPRYKDFDKTVTDWVAGKQVATWDQPA